MMLDLFAHWRNIATFVEMFHVEAKNHEKRRRIRSG